ncbi:sensor histidine kinase [Glaciecola petra]|uniref:Histidine kinase n=1 Tax=Glaciecola petra TaxID=3075602 RepID=A0ABU2ZP70_9ALTE|nr:histidine kinase [Aestuariibacter sp. P117]MDT0594422.1 histidine kinase [Aestuariibacter sp. P117]
MVKQERNIKETRFRKPSFWLLHSVGWFVYWVLFITENTLLVPEMKGSSLHIAIPLFASAFMAAVITIPLRYIYQRCWQLHPTKILMVVIISCVVASLIWTPAKNMAMWKFNESDYAMATKKGNAQDKNNQNEASEFNSNKQLKESDACPSESKPNRKTVFEYFNSLVYSLAMILAWSTLYFSISFYFRLVSEKEMHLAAVRLSHSAQIKMLRYQINPHFLFNTLNAISTLVLMGNKEKANGMLVRLSTFLRFSLDNDPEKKIALYDELKALMLYLEIEKTRFDERLNIQFDVEHETENYLVPSLLLQPLVENCIKYAIAKMATNGQIAIKASSEGRWLCLEVADNGPDANLVLDHFNAKQNTKNEGVGLRNIRERLMVLYPKEFTFSMDKNDLGGLSVLIKIPLEKNA